MCVRGVRVCVCECECVCVCVCVCVQSKVTHEWVSNIFVGCIGSMNDVAQYEHFEFDEE